MGKYLDQYIKDMEFEVTMGDGFDQIIARDLLTLAEAIQADLSTESVDGTMGSLLDTTRKSE